tara:strand:- start:292 stop:2745 length:2454 start_codon:yes stop_codon:yes gene_type:complete
VANINSFENLPDDVLLEMVKDPLFDENDPSWQQSAEDYMANSMVLDSIDIKSGAPINVRASVNAAQSEDDRLLTLKNFYPDAVRIEDLDPEYGATRFGAGNFVYTDPETQELTLFDERGGLIFGASLADLTADIGPEIAETIGAIGGGIAGAIGGAAATPFTAGVVNPVTGALAGEGVGSASAREAYIGMLNYFGETEDNRTLGETGKDFVFTAGLNASAGPLMAKFWGGLKYAGNSVRYMADTMNVEAREAYKKLTSVISNPTPGQINLNPMTNLLERVLEKLPFASKTMHETAKRTLIEVERAAVDIANKAGGPRSQTEAAEELLRKGSKDEGISPGSLRAAKQRYKEQSNANYTAVNNMLPDGNIKQIDALQGLHDELVVASKTAVGNRTSNTGLATLEPIFKDFSEGNLNWNDLRKLRTQLMDDTRSSVANGATSQSQKNEIKRVIGAITEVLDGHVGSFGDDALEESYKAANKYVRTNMDKMSGPISYIDNILNKEGSTIESALKGIVNGTKDGPAGVRKLKEVLTEEEFSVLPGYILGRMGLPTPGMSEGVELGVESGAEYIAKSGFSPATFIKNWNSMSKEAKDVLFKNSEFANLGKELDNLVFTVQRIKDAGRLSGNPSNTGQVTHALAWATSIGGGSTLGMEFGLGTVVAPAGVAKLMTNPAFVRWLAEGTEIVASNPNSMAQHVRRLLQIQAVNPEIRDEVRAILQGLQGETTEPMPENVTASMQANPMSANEGKFRQVSTAEVSDKLLSDNNLAESINNFSIPQSEGNMFAQTDIDPMLMQSPSLLPDEKDREIAMRQQAGILGLS